MKKIVLLCAAGMSTSMLVKKMQTAAEKQGYECQIEAHPLSEVDMAKDANIVLLGPQVRFQLSKIKEKVSCPVEAIEMSAYGTMNGEKVLESAKKIMGE